MDPKVSIIIPIYKTAQWLPKCVDSCLNQTYSNIEIILIDDGSPDNCGEICDRYAERDARVIVIHQENGGVSAARNAGLKKASGELIQFVDSDDWVDTDMVSCMIKAQLTKQYDLVICGMNVFRGQHPFSVKTPAEKERCRQIDLISDLLRHKDLIYFEVPWNKLYKKSIIDKFSLHFDTSLKSGEDFSFVLDYIEHAESCFYLGKALYNVQKLTFDKSAHYRASDIEYQWDLNVKIFSNYRELFINTDTYTDFKERANTFFLKRIWEYLRGGTVFHYPKKAIVSLLKTFSASDIYEDLIEIHLADVDSYSEKIVLICCKYKLWNLLLNFLYMYSKARSAMINIFDRR